MSAGDRVRKNGGRMGHRMIRVDGRVRWCGSWYRIECGALAVADHERIPMPERPRREFTPKYDGRMDGKVGLFYDYGPQYGHLNGFIWLHSIPGEPWPGSSCVNGVFAWDTFKREAGAPEQGGKP